MGSHYSGGCMITIEEEIKLSYLSKENQEAKIKRFILNMMDLTEQTESEIIYIKMYKALEDI